MKKNTKIIAAVSVAAVITIGAGVGYGVHQYNLKQEAIAISEYNQAAEHAADAYRADLNQLMLNEDTMEHDAVLQNMQDLQAFQTALDAATITYHDGTTNLYDAIIADANAAFDADKTWMQDSYKAALAAVITDGDDKDALKAGADAATALAEQVEADYAACAGIWNSTDEKDAFVAECTAAATAASDRIAAIEKAEAEQKAKEEAERKAAEEEAARQAAAEAEAAKSYSSSDNGGSSKSSKSSSKSSSSHSGSSNSGSSKSSSSNSSSSSEKSISNSKLSQDEVDDWNKALASQTDDDI